MDVNTNNNNKNKLSQDEREKFEQLLDEVALHFSENFDCKDYDFNREDMKTQDWKDLGCLFAVDQKFFKHYNPGLTHILREYSNVKHITTMNEFEKFKDYISKISKHLQTAMKEGYAYFELLPWPSTDNVTLDLWSFGGLFVFCNAYKYSITF